MFRFEHPEYFIVFALLLIVGAGVAYSAWQNRNASERFASASAWSRLTAALVPGRRTVRSVLILVSIAFMCLALVNPQWGLRRETVEATSSDIYIALDISNSMLARDIAPSRLERAKRFARDLIDEFKGDRIGLIFFAGSAYLQMPLTNDYASAELFVESANPRLAATQGTSIGDAIELAMRAFQEDVPHQRALIILTDGENHEEGAIEAMQAGRDAGLVPFVISVGTTNGDFIPIEIDGREDFKRDETGTPVKTAVNENFLRQLAEVGGGALYSILDGDALIDEMRDRMAELEKREMEQRAFKEYRSYFQYFLFIGLVLFIVQFMLGDAKLNSRVKTEDI